MNIIINNNQFQSILKESKSVDSFLKLITEKYPKTKDFINLIEKFILESGCRRIEVFEIKQGLGVSLSDRVVISTRAFSESLPKFLFILFHEIAHQFQYKKYGAEKMYECYKGEISIKYASEFMSKVEIVADEFATRKVREFIKLGHLESGDDAFKGFYKKIPANYFIALINSIRKMIKEKDIKDPAGISELFYNWIKNSI